MGDQEKKRRKQGFFSFQRRGRAEKTSNEAVEWRRDDYFQYAVGSVNRTWNVVLDGGVTESHEYGIFTNLPGETRRPNFGLAKSIASSLKDMFKGDHKDKEGKRWRFSFTAEGRSDDFGSDRGEVKCLYYSPDIKPTRQSFRPDE